MPLSVSDIKALNIEVSSKCSAQCPFCSRLQKTRKYGGHSISYQDFLKLPSELIAALKRVTFAGNFGDFSTNSEVLRICQYLKERNPKVQLGGDTNGMIQAPHWWAKLGETFHDGELIFSLDGLEDTHALHRINTDFTTVVSNLKAFVEGGGIAHWKFIVFEHNEHQIHKAADIAEEIGCKRFIAISSRDYSEKLRPPVRHNITLKRELFKNHCSSDAFSGCKPVDKGSIYIAADGTVHPCCFAHCMYITEHNDLFRFIIPLIEEDIDLINFKTNSLESILRGSYFEKVVSIAPNNPYCQMKCSSFKKSVRRQLIVFEKDLNGSWHHGMMGNHDLK